jgi:hypothetical protein
MSPPDLTRVSPRASLRPRGSRPILSSIASGPPRGATEDAQTPPAGAKPTGAPIFARPRDPRRLRGSRPLYHAIGDIEAALRVR